MNRHRRRDGQDEAQTNIDEERTTTPPPEKLQLLNQLLTPKCTSRKEQLGKSPSVIRQEAALRKKMAGVQHEGLLAIAEVEVDRKPPDGTRPLSELLNLIVPSDYVCACYKVKAWRRGNAVGFTDDEMNRLRRFLHAAGHSDESPDEQTEYMVIDVESQSETASSPSCSPIRKQKRRQSSKDISSDDWCESSSACSKRRKTKKKSRKTLRKGKSSKRPPTLSVPVKKAKRSIQNPPSKPDDGGSSSLCPAVSSTPDVTASDKLESTILQYWSSFEPLSGRVDEDLDKEAEWLRVYNGKERIKGTIDPIPLIQSETPALKSDVKKKGGPTRLHTLMTTVSAESLQFSLAQTVPASHETQQKHRWVYRLLETYAESLSIETMLPLTPARVSEFITILGVNNVVSWQSLNTSVRGGLLFLDFVHRGSPTPESVVLAIKQSLERVWNMKSKRNGSGGKPPLIVPDMVRILEHIPDCLVEKPFDASLFLFGLCTGARASSCAGIQLADIERIICLSESSVLLVTIRLRKMKGHHGEDQIVTLEGDVCAKATLNVVFWLEAHLQQEFGISLINRDRWEELVDTRCRLWDTGVDNMTIRLQNRAFQAGYPLKYFGFHSLRSGFISSALLKAGDNDARRTRVMEQTAIVARWVPFSKVQMAYIKSAAIGMHVANRLPLPDDCLHSTNVLESVLSNSEIFHNQELFAIPWSGGETLECFQKHVTVVLAMCCSLLSQSVDRPRAIKDIAIHRYCSKLSIPHDEFVSSIQKKLSGGEDPLELARSFVSLVYDELKAALTQKRSCPIIPPIIQKTTRPRQYWSDWELRELAEGKKSNETWDEISMRIKNKGGERTAQNCAMRWYAAKRDLKKIQQEGNMNEEDIVTVLRVKTDRKSALVQVLEEAQKKQEEESSSDTN
ncbi:hypothetical protein BLNAU_18247 [Blattamonas nauphoetae]|uniref:Myb-like domain-containing protein n=1 Tax=Blattamonas nauphoetae TaxID=2049346 RepID=A0ABQ9X4U7_9EUKA|nr:hypothetical protein BLNAU_18247 [Blattamonas nauphoetae]